MTNSTVFVLWQLSQGTSDHCCIVQYVSEVTLLYVLFQRFNQVAHIYAFRRLLNRTSKNNIQCVSNFLFTDFLKVLNTLKCFGQLLDASQKTLQALALEKYCYNKLQKHFHLNKWILFNYTFGSFFHLPIQTWYFLLLVVESRTVTELQHGQIFKPLLDSNLELTANSVIKMYVPNTEVILLKMNRKPNLTMPRKLQKHEFTIAKGPKVRFRNKDDYLVLTEHLLSCCIHNHNRTALSIG